MVRYLSTYLWYEEDDFHLLLLQAASGVVAQVVLYLVDKGVVNSMTDAVDEAG